METFAQEIVDLFMDIIIGYGRASVTMPSPYPNTAFDLHLRDGTSIMPALDHGVVKNIAKQAINGNLTAMYTLSRMYLVGLGVPRDEHLSYCWSQFSLTEGSLVTFESAVKTLKTHVRGQTKEFAYPDILDSIYDNMIPFYKEVDFVDLGDVLPSKKRFYAVPMYAGIRLFLVYRVDVQTQKCYLYDARAGGKHGDRISLDVLPFLGIPVMLGDLRKKNTLPDYVATMHDFMEGKVSYITVAGTLFINPAKRAFIKRALPTIKKASELFNALIGSKTVARLPYKDSTEFTKLKTKRDRIAHKLEAIANGTYMEELRERFEHAKTAYRRAKESANSDGMLEAKAAADSVKKEKIAVDSNGTAYKKFLQIKLTDLQTELDSVNKHNEELRLLHEAQYPETGFLFQATDLYYGNSGTITPVPVGNHIYQHLSSLGFTSTFNTSLFEPTLNTVWTFSSKREVLAFLKGRYDEYVKASPYHITGLILRDGETVKAVKANVSYVCYFNKRETT
jgi:hypothetical protein